MGSVNGKLCAVIVIAGTALGIREIARRYYFIEVKEEKPLSWKPVGRVTELAVYPVRQGEKRILPKVYCTQNGLRSTLDENFQDGCFILYESGNTKVLPEENYNFDKIKVECTIDKFVLMAEGLESLSLPYDKLNVEFTLIEIHKGEVVPVRDCGEDAANWVTEALPDTKKKLRLGYYIMDLEKEPVLNEWYEKLLNSIKCFTSNGLIIHPGLTYPLLINEDSIDGVGTTLQSFLNPYNFNANIVIQYTTGSPLEEYTWKKVKFEKVEFDCIKSCKNCIINRNTLLGYSSKFGIDMRNVMMALKSSLQKYVGFKVKDTPYIGISLKLSSDEGEIKLNSKVFALC